jgi:phosphodiesterase/alkaline phosphatase D-like protein
MESWGHFPHERARLLRLLSQTPGAVILSGDVHYSEILSPSNHLEEVDDTKSSPTTINSFFEVTSSGLTHTCKNAFYGAVCEPLLESFHKHRSLENRHNYYFRPNYGTLVIDWDKRIMQVSIHDSQTGQVVMTTKSRSFEQQYQWTQQELDGVIPCMDGHLVPVAKAVAMGGILALLILRFAGRRR